MDRVQRHSDQEVGAGEDQRMAPLVIGFLLTVVMSACAPPLEEASYARLKEAQRKWAANPVPSYRIVVEVERPGETRRYAISVSGGEVAHATLDQSDASTGLRSEPLLLEQQQAYPFTVSGLFELVLSELQVGARSEILVAIEGEPAFPRRIELGPVLRDGHPLEGTQSTITVRSFESLGSTDGP